MTAGRRAMIGWVLSGLLSAFLIIASAGGKFIEWDGKSEMMERMGWDSGLMVAIGVLETAVALIFLVPHTAFVGAVLLTAYLGGAVATHVRIDEPYYFPALIGVLAWVALGLRDPRVFAAAFRWPPAADTP